MTRLAKSAAVLAINVFLIRIGIPLIVRKRGGCPDYEKTAEMHRSSPPTSFASPSTAMHCGIVNISSSQPKHQFIQSKVSVALKKQFSIPGSSKNNLQAA